MPLPDVSLVIPGRNCARTLRPCLEAVVPMLSRGALREIIFVDDGSTDDSAAVARSVGVRVIAGSGAGPGAARNIGWRAAAASLVWFVDSDCVAEPDALALLLPHLEDARVAAVSGSYGTMTADSLLASLIHEEIVARHARMPSRVTFLATFNVLYRRSVLEALGGFNERFLKGQDAELSWRALEAGHELGFEMASRVRHFHPVSLIAYLRTQSAQGYWRVSLHREHAGHARGDSYSGWVDHAQPLVAMLALASVPLMWWSRAVMVTPALVAVLALLQVPMTLRLVRRTRSARYLTFAAMSFVRAFARGWGMTRAVVHLLSRRTPESSRRESMAQSAER